MQQYGVVQKKNAFGRNDLSSWQVVSRDVKGGKIQVVETATSADAAHSFAQILVQGLDVESTRMSKYGEHVCSEATRSNVPLSSRGAKAVLSSGGTIIVQSPPISNLRLVIWKECDYVQVWNASSCEFLSTTHPISAEAQIVFENFASEQFSIGYLLDGRNVLCVTGGVCPGKRMSELLCDVHNALHQRKVSHLISCIEIAPFQLVETVEELKLHKQIYGNTATFFDNNVLVSQCDEQ